MALLVARVAVLVTCRAGLVTGTVTTASTVGTGSRAEDGGQSLGL